MLNRFVHIAVLIFALAASAAAQNPYLQGSLSGGTGVPGTKTRSALNTMERAAGSLAGVTILTDTFGNQRLALYVHIEDTCINYTPAPTGNTQNLSAFVEKCATDSVWYIDWEGKSQFIGGAGAVCDEDWLQISDNSCPDAITDSIYHYRYAAIGARLVWPTAEFLVSDSSAVQVSILSGNRNSRLGFYDNFNQVYSTIDQSGVSTIWYFNPTGEMRFVTAGGGTPQSPGAPFVNQFAIDPNDLPLPTIQAHLYPNTRSDTNTVRNFIYTDNVGKFRSQPIDSLSGLATNWYNSDGTTTDATRTATILESAEWLGDAPNGYFYFEMGSLGGGRLEISTNETRSYYQDVSGGNVVSANISGVDIITNSNASRAVDIFTDTVNTRGHFDPTNFRLNFLSDNSYLFADSLKVVGLGQFPGFPSLNFDGTEKGFLYDQSDDGVVLINGDGTSGGYTYVLVDINSIDNYIQFDGSGNDYVDIYGQTGSDNSYQRVAVSSDESPLGDSKLILISADPSTAENLFGVAQGVADSVAASLYFGESSIGSDFYEGRRAFGVRTYPNEDPFDWIQAYLQNDTVENAVSFYNRAYYWRNEHPIGAAGDTLLHFWAATGPGGEAGRDPGFMTLDQVCAHCADGITADNGLNMSAPGNVQLGGTLLKNTTISTTSGFNLTVSGDVPFSAGIGGTLNVDNASAASPVSKTVRVTANTGFGVHVTSTAGVGTLSIGTTGVKGEGTIGIHGQTTTGYGAIGQATSASGIGVSATSAGNFAIQAAINPASTNTVIPIMGNYRNTTGTPASGLGESIDFYIEDSANNDELVNQIISKATTVTDGAEVSEFSITGKNGGALTALLTLAGNGNATINNGNLSLGTAGNKINITTGSNAAAGTSAAMTAGTITISTTAVSANSIILLTHATFGGTTGVLRYGNIVAGTSFDIISSNAADTGTVGWIIFN